ncbi:MAG: HAD family hydrolase [Candidatus Lokiarchaeota archaeon]|nr:HAD family hydrolase [Candidatus Lokiarchaeota archaeon]
MKYLFLFDIDGTLVKGFHAHHKAFINSIKKIFNIDTTIEMYQYHGSTDLYIIYDVLAKNKIPIEMIDRQLDRIKDEMIKIYEKEVLKEKIQVLSGALEVLNLIKNRNEGLGLVTGNLSKIAYLKLKQVYLSNYFPIGGFGETSKLRLKLILKAIKEAEKYYGLNFNNEDIYIIGDTPRDIDAAHQAHVNAISIASGMYRREDLIKNNPKYVFNDLLGFLETLENDFF